MHVTDDVPDVHYARSGDLHIAYQVIGGDPSGPAASEYCPDLVFIPSWFSHLDLMWEQPVLVRFFQRLASFSRVILFDKRGTGLSDPVPLDELPTLEQRMDDVRAVLDAAGSERAAIFGATQGGPLAALFAATHPDRTSALVLFNTSARATRADDYPIGLPREGLDEYLATVEAGWGSVAALDQRVLGDVDEPLKLWMARYQRQALSPGAAVALLRMTFDVDVRDVLPAIQVPTLVIHRSENSTLPSDHGRYLADNIPGAQFVEVPGRDNLWLLGDHECVLDEVQEFLTGVRDVPESDRVLATVLFTDIVESTKLAASIGDARWRDILDAHDAMVRRQLDRFRGREVDTVGDGFLATFDGPARAIRCAGAIVAGARQLGISVRAGLHTGECEVRGDGIGGIAVHIGSRVADQAQPGEVLVSSTVKDLVAGSGIHFDDRGARLLKGVPGEWHLFAASV